MRSGSRPSPRPRKAPRVRPAFTLIELLVAAAVVVVLAAILCPVLAKTQQVHAAVRPNPIERGPAATPETSDADRLDEREVEVDVSGPTVRLREAPLVEFPGAGEPGFPHYGESDCNSPAHWDGDTFYLFNSAVQSSWSSGSDLFRLSESHRNVVFDREFPGGQWIESTWKAEDGTLYGWYHNEPPQVVPEREPERHLTAPRIGAARSRDNGATWENLGLILEAPPNALRRDTQNTYFAGGNGDFSVIADARREYLYFFFSTYHPEATEQGVAVARMRYADRDHPVGKVRKWRAERWSEPGIGGRVTPFLPVTRDWHQQDADAFWGPSIHWNSHLKQYVILLNRAKNSHWAQEGIYVSFNPDLTDPKGWSRPRRILGHEEIASDPGAPAGWYPQVIGLDTKRRETDKLAGRMARLFVHGSSRWEILFLRPGEDKLARNVRPLREESASEGDG